MGQVLSVNASSSKGSKQAVATGQLLLGQGLAGDFHSGSERQVSLLAQESTQDLREAGVALVPGDFGENVTLTGLEPRSLAVGARLQVGEALLQVTQIGKLCETPCSIGRRFGTCAMQKDGWFARVMRGGSVTAGDEAAAVTSQTGAVLTASDRASDGERPDTSGPLLLDLLEELGLARADYSIIPDDEEQLRNQLLFLADRCATDLILTTGGTGLGPRDCMPEATLAILDKQAPGVVEALRHAGAEFTPWACISRGLAGLRKRSLIINLPGSQRAVSQSLPLLRQVLPHMLEALERSQMDCGLTPAP